MRRELIALTPSVPPNLALRSVPQPKAGAGQVLVRVQATSVNPIDVRRAGGYGRRLLRLKGASRFPLVLGNDVAGIVEEVGTGIRRLRPGQAVFGLVPTGPGGGAHATHILAREDHLMPAPAGLAPAGLATLPYSFTTMWLAVRAAGLGPENAASRRVLVSGASGGLGRLALQLLRGWQCDTTAVCDPERAGEALSLGANSVVERGTPEVAGLPSGFDVVLNFGSWASEPTLVSKLGTSALGYATTVHPLLANLDALGWGRGAAENLRTWRAMRAATRARSAAASYSWVLFGPQRAALDVLERGVGEGSFALPVGLAQPFDNAAAVFDHVARGGDGRGVLLP
ncbi:MAG: hypothetical protein AMXMBFR53_01990 [Gemmatimonadota bacterium]